MSMNKPLISELLTPLALGDLSLPNRIVMAPLTRNRAGEGNVPTALNVEYYRQRASAGEFRWGNALTPRIAGRPETDLYQIFTFTLH